MTVELYCLEIECSKKNTNRGLGSEKYFQSCFISEATCFKRATRCRKVSFGIDKCRVINVLTDLAAHLAQDVLLATDQRLQNHFLIFGKTAARRPLKISK